MKPNVLKFQNDIKIQVEKQKQTGDCDWWMHPVYCAYYILKHGVEDIDKYIKEDIERSYKALPDYWRKEHFKEKVSEYLKEYAEETVCADKQ